MRGSSMDVMSTVTKETDASLKPGNCKETLTYAL